MIALAVGLALQVGSAQALVVRTSNETVRIPTTRTADGQMVSVESLSRVMPIRASRDSGSFYTLDIWGARLQVAVGSKIVSSGDVVRPIASAPSLRNGTLMIPVQLVTELFPTLVPNNRWDADASQLVLFTSSANSLAAQTTTVRQAGTTTNSDGDEIPRFIPPKGGALAVTKAKKPGRHLVIVDAGHGGVDNGMSGPIGGGPKIYEKNITLAVSKKLGKELESRGVDVVYTRTTDTLIALDDRGRIANKTQGELFISIHVNAANPNWKDPGGSRGFETYFLSEARTEDARRVEHMENDATRFESVPENIDKDNPLSFIFSDMQQNEHLRESSRLAELIQARLAKMHPGPSRGVKQAGFRVLVTAYMPAVLVEIGFGTNPRDAAYISDPDKQAALADAIADAAMEFLDHYDGSARGTSGGKRQ